MRIPESRSSISLSPLFCIDPSREKSAWQWAETFRLIGKRAKKYFFHSFPHCSLIHSLCFVSSFRHSNNDAATNFVVRTYFYFNFWHLYHLIHDYISWLCYSTRTISSYYSSLIRHSQYFFSLHVTIIIIFISIILINSVQCSQLDSKSSLLFLFYSYYFPSFCHPFYHPHLLRPSYISSFSIFQSNKNGQKVRDQVSNMKKSYKILLDIVGREKEEREREMNKLVGGGWSFSLSLLLLHRFSVIFLPLFFLGWSPWDWLNR